MPYRSAYAPKLADLLMRQGDIAAQREMDRGRIWGGAVQGIGQQVGGVLGQIAQQKADAPRLAMENEAAQLDLDAKRRTSQAGARADQEAEALKTAKTRDDIFAIVGPERGAKIVQGLSALADQDNKTFVSTQQRLGVLGMGVKALPAPMQAEAWQSTVDDLVQRGLFTPENAPKTPDEAIQRAVSPDKFFDSQQPRVLNRGAQMRGPNGEMVADNPITPEPPSVGSFEDFITQQFGARPTPEQIAQARKVYNQSDDRPQSVRPTGLTPNAEANLTRQLVNQWTAASKPARDLERQVSLIDAGMDAARRGDLAQGSQTVLVAFQKILDPTSVVREAEFDRSAAGQSLMNRVRGAAERLSKGGSGISLPELEKFYTLAKEASEAQRGSYLKSVQQRIGRTADRYQIPQELVFEAQPDVAPAGGGTVRMRAPNGQEADVPADQVEAAKAKGATVLP